MGKKYKSFKELNYRGSDILNEVKNLINDGRDPSEDNNYAIAHASEKGAISAVVYLLKDTRVDPSARGDYAIRGAVENGHLAVVKTLLEDTRVDPNVDNGHPLKETLKKGSINVLKLLLKRKDLKVTTEDLILAVERNVPIILLLILKDARTNPNELPKKIKEDSAFIEVLKQANIQKIGKFKDFLNL